MTIGVVPFIALLLTTQFTSHLFKILKFIIRHYEVPVRKSYHQNYLQSQDPL